MGNPVLMTGYGAFYYLCDRDPTSTELDVLDPANAGVGVYVNIPDFKYYWFNTISNEIFWCTDNSFNAMIWHKMADNLNIDSILSSSSWKLNSSRSYVERSTPAFNTNYTPSVTNDTFVLATVNIVLSILQSSTITAEIDTGSGFVTVATAANDAVAINNTSTLSFIVPAGATYKIVSAGTGTNTLNSIMELSL
jgi:hypothetical protein